MPGREYKFYVILGVYTIMMTVSQNIFVDFLGIMGLIINLVFYLKSGKLHEMAAKNRPKAKQTTIYELLPRLRRGWVAMYADGQWCWFAARPEILDLGGVKLWCPSDKEGITILSILFDIAPFAGDWKDSLMECGK